jgi:peptide/nickel transport system substrate-binding protein
LLDRTAVIAAVAAMLAACSSTGSSTGDPSGVPDNLTVGFAAKIQTLDPDLALDYGSSVLHLIGGTLYEANGDKTLPGLASGEPTISEDKLTWTIKLRDGLTFSDGAPLTSKDVKASFDRARNDKASVNLTLLQPITAVNAPDAATVELTLNRPYPSLQTILTYPQFVVFPASGVGSENFFDAPISAGPYTLKSWGGGNTATLEANPKYAGEKPTISTLTFKVVPDTNSQLAQVQSGQLDMAYAVPPNLISQIKKPATAQVTPSYGMETMTMRTTADGPLSEVGVRKAIAAAIDREQLSKVVWEGKVKAQSSLWPSTMAGYSDSQATTPDLQTAGDALEGTSCENGCKLGLTYSSAAFPEHAQEAPVIKASLEKIGIDVTLKNVDAVTLFDSLGGSFELLLFPLFDLGSVPDGIVSYGLSETTEVQYSGLQLPGLAAASKQAQESTGQDQLDGLKQLDDLLSENQPWTPLTGYAVVTASRHPVKTIGVGPSTLIQVVRADGTVR